MSEPGLPESPRPWWLLPRGRLNAGWWFAIVIPLLAIEYITGFYSQFPVVYVIPVSLAAWYSGRWPAVLLAIGIPLAHFVFTITTPNHTETFLLLLTQTAIRSAVVVFMALWFARLSEYERELKREVQTLKGLLPICSFCKSIRNESGEWERLERFISRKSETQFSHGLCPTCLETQYPMLKGIDA